MTTARTKTITAPARPAPTEVLTEYRLPVGLLQAVVNYLNTRPCIETRALMNAIEGEAQRQDLEHQTGTGSAS